MVVMNTMLALFSYCSFDHKGGMYSSGVGILVAIIIFFRFVTSTSIGRNLGNEGRLRIATSLPSVWSRERDDANKLRLCRNVTGLQVTKKLRHRDSDQIRLLLTRLIDIEQYIDIIDI